MNGFSHMFTILFIAALVVSVLVKFWLSRRQIQHVLAHRDAVPERFATVVSLSAHQKAADYTVARTRLASIEILADAVLLVALTLLGGIQSIDLGLNTLLSGTSAPNLLRGIALVCAVGLISALVDLPFSVYRQFGLEVRFGFNRMSITLFVADLLKGLVLLFALGLPLLAAVLYLMSQAGAAWWVYAWLVWIGFNLLVLLLYPTVIAPWFNKFQPLEDSSLRERIDALLARCGFATKGVFVMDGSKRSAHGNAYFTGFGASKRIVFFDTLLDRLSAPEIEAVLAHELGHFKKRHVLKRIAWSFAASFVGLGLLGWLKQEPWFFSGLGVDPSLATRDAVALTLFFFVMPVFTFLLSPLFSLASRKHEYEADAFAAAQTRPADLVAALVKLYEDNASTLTPDPLHSAFYDSHPPAALRIQRLDASPV